MLRKRSTTSLYRASPSEARKPRQKGKDTPGSELEPRLASVVHASDLHDVHAGLAKLVDEVLPHEEVQQLPRLCHHHLALCDIVQGLKKCFAKAKLDFFGVLDDRKIGSHLFGVTADN